MHTKKIKKTNTMKYHEETFFPISKSLCSPAHLWAKDTETPISGWKYTGVDQPFRQNQL